MKEITKEKLNRFKDYVLDVFFPRHIKCIFCGSELSERDTDEKCSDCSENLPFITNPCPRCGRSRADNNNGVCLSCKATNYHFEFARSVFEYRDQITSVIHKYKFGSMKFLYEPLSKYMCYAFEEMKIDVDLVCAVPLSKKRLKERGFNQSELLAKAVCEKFGLRFVDLIEKIKDNPAQAKLGFKERAKNVLDVYKLRAETRKEIKGKTILLIDDVFTTGATTNEISRILKSHGAKKIYVLTLAHSGGKEQV